MTILVEPMHDTAGFGEAWAVTFQSVRVRQSFDGTGMVTKTPHRVEPISGVLTTPDLDPGQTLIKIGTETRLCEIPDSGITLRLYPIWEGGATWEGSPPQPVPDGYVRNGGDVYRIQAMSEGEYSSLVAADPNTIYILFP
jgi:hypothetical protein